MKQIKYLHLANFQHLNFLLGSSLSKVKKSITTSINLKIGVQVKKKKKEKSLDSIYRSAFLTVLFYTILYILGVI